MIIDAHAHCGRQDRFPPQDIADYLASVGSSGIEAAVMFAPVMEIYDRYDPCFLDTAEWRERREDANRYLLTAGTPGFRVFPFFFIWNDFAVEQICPEHKGIKWHRHEDEPVYEYDSLRCAAAIETIRERRMPVVLEEEFGNTLRFIHELATGVQVIIPHLGFLNGGYENLRRRGVWELPDVWADTALAPPGDIKDYIRRYGHERLMFGSDFPFGNPARELDRVLSLDLTGEQRAAVCGGNAAGLLSESNA